MRPAAGAFFMDCSLLRRGVESLRRAMWSHYRLGPALEMTLGGIFVAYLIFAFSWGLIVRVWPVLVWDGFVSLIGLWHVDGTATLQTAAQLIARLALGLLPSMLLIYRSQWRRRFWLIPLVVIITAWISLAALTACETVTGWLLLIGVSAAATGLSRVRFLGWTALLPFALLLGVLPRHWIGEARLVGTAERERLFVDCSHHDGVRPANLNSDFVMPYFGITPLNEDVILLTGKGQNRPGGPRPPQGSWWLRRHGGRFEIEQPSAVWGNLWRGCVLDDTLWMGRANYLIGARWLDGNGPLREQVFKEWLPAHEFDFQQAACDTQRHRVYTGEETRGGLWDFQLATGEARRFQLGGRGLMPRFGADGNLVVVSTAELLVWAPGEERVVQRVPAALISNGFDVCPTDGAAAVADTTGRLRIFELDGARQYRFTWGLPIFAPRRVAFSHDCSRLAVTSADDQHVYMIDRATRRIVETHLAGPALREVVATGPREFSITDVCSVTTYQW